MDRVQAMPFQMNHLQVIRNEGIKEQTTLRQIEFKKGQTVMCVNTDTPKGFTFSGIKKGGIYKINDIGKCLCGESYVCLDGIPFDEDKYCVCDRKTPYNAFRFSRFELVHLTVVNN